MARRTRNSGAWIGAVLVATGAAWAEPAKEGGAAEDKDAPKESQKVEYVEVSLPYAPQSSSISTKLPLDPQMVPANIGSVTSALFNEQNAFNLSAALLNVSGINVVNGSGVHDYFVMRGFDSLDGGLVLTDGANEPEATFYPTYNIDAVEVHKGPTGYLYGGGPLAGTVNMTRKQPIPGDLIGVNVLGGSFGTWQANVDWNAGSDDGDAGFRINALGRETDSYRDDKDGSLYAVNPTFMLRVGEASSLNFAFEFAQSEYTPDSGLPLFNNALPDVGRKNDYQPAFDFSEQDSYRFQVDYQNRLSERVTLRNKTFYRQLDWNSFGTLFLTSFDVGLGPQALRNGVSLDDRQEFYGNQLEAVVKVGNKVTNNFLFGLEVQRQDDDFDIGNLNPCMFPPGFGETGCMPWIDIVNDPVDTATPDLVNQAAPFQVGNSETTIVAPYVIDQIRFSPKWELMLGARFDNIDTDVTFTQNAAFLCGSGYSRSDSEVSPMAGLVYAPDEEVSIYANAGRAFAPVGPRVINSCELDPEESRQGEVGAKKKFLGGKLHSTAAVYYIERDNVPIANVSGVSQSAGDQESKGFEFDVAADLPSRVRLFFSYAYNDAELTNFTEFDPITMTFNDRSGNSPSFAPENVANLWIGTTFKGGLGLGGGPRFVDDQFIDPSNAFEIDSYLIWNAMVFYDFDQWRFKVNFENLTDEDYETRSSLRSASVVPANPFTVFAGVEFRQ